MNFVTTDDGKLDMLTIKTILFGRIELIQFIIPFDAVIDGIDIANGTDSRFRYWPDFMITWYHRVTPKRWYGGKGGKLLSST